MGLNYTMNHLHARYFVVHAYKQVKGSGESAWSVQSDFDQGQLVNRWHCYQESNYSSHLDHSSIVQWTLEVLT